MDAFSRFERKANAKLNRLTANLGASSSARVSKPPAPAVQVQVVGSWTKGATPPPVPERKPGRARSTPDMFPRPVQKTSTAQPPETREQALQRQRLQLEASVAAANARVAATRAWLDALARHAQLAVDAQRAHDSAKNAHDRSLADERAVRQSATLTLRARASDAQRRHELQSRLAQVASEEQAALAAHDEAAARPTLTKGATVFAHRGQGDAWAAARVEHAMSSGTKYLLAFEASKVRAVCDVAQIRACAPEERNALEARFQAMRDEVSQQLAAIAEAAPLDELRSELERADDAERAADARGRAALEALDAQFLAQDAVRAAQLAEAVAQWQVTCACKEPPSLESEEALAAAAAQQLADVVAELEFKLEEVALETLEAGGEEEEEPTVVAPPPKLSPSLLRRTKNKTAQDEMDEIDLRLRAFERLLDDASNSGQGATAAASAAVHAKQEQQDQHRQSEKEVALLREKEEQIAALAAQVAALKEALDMAKREPAKAQAEEEEWRPKNPVTETYEHVCKSRVVGSGSYSREIFHQLLDFELPELPAQPVDISNTIAYKNYMRLRYEYQRRGLLEEKKRVEDNAPTPPKTVARRAAPRPPPVPVAAVVAAAAAEFRAAEYVEALLAEDGFYYVAEVQQARDPARITVMFTEYGCFGTVQLCSAAQLKRLAEQPRYPLKSAVQLAGAEAVVEKIALSASRTEFAYHVRMASTGKVCSCVGAELKPSRLAPALPLASSRMSVMVESLDWEITHLLFDDQTPLASVAPLSEPQRESNVFGRESDAAEVQAHLDAAEAGNALHFAEHERVLMRDEGSGEWVEGVVLGGSEALGGTQPVYLVLPHGRDVDVAVLQCDMRRRVVYDVHDLVEGCWTEDGVWYPAVVESVNAAGDWYLIRFAEYNNIQRCGPSLLRPLPGMGCTRCGGPQRVDQRTGRCWWCGE